MEDDHEVVLLGFWTSPYAMRVKIALDEKGIHYQKTFSKIRAPCFWKWTQYTRKFQYSSIVVSPYVNPSSSSNILMMLGRTKHHHLSLPILTTEQKQDFGLIPSTIRQVGSSVFIYLCICWVEKFLFSSTSNLLLCLHYNRLYGLQSWKVVKYKLLWLKVLVTVCTYMHAQLSHILMTQTSNKAITAWTKSFFPGSCHNLAKYIMWSYSRNHSLF